MNQEAFISAKKEYTKILKEEQLVYDTFIAPFKRLFTAIKLTAKTVLNVAGLAWGTFTLSPKKMKEARANFDKRQSEIESEWKPVLEESEKYLGSGEAALAALMFAPTATITAVAAKAGFKGTIGTIDVLDKSGLKIPLISKAASAFSGNDFSIDTNSGNTGGSGSGGKENRSLLQKIAGLFYIESSWLEGELILESEDKSFTEDDFKKELPIWLKSTGIEANIEKSAKVYYESFEETLNDIVEEAEIKISVLKSISKMESFEQASQMLSTSGIDSSAILGDLKKSKLEVMKDKGFIKGVPKELKKKNPTEKEIEAEAEKAVLRTSVTRIEQIKMQAKDQIDTYFPKEIKVEILESTNAGKKFIQLFETAKLSISNA